MLDDIASQNLPILINSHPAADVYFLSMATIYVKSAARRFLLAPI